MTDKLRKLTAIAAAAVFAFSLTVPADADEDDQYYSDYGYYDDYGYGDYGYYDDYGYSDNDYTDYDSGSEVSDDEAGEASVNETEDDFDADENSRQSEELERESSELSEKLKLTEKEIEERKAKSRELQEKIEALSKSIKETNGRISVLEKQIDEKRELIEQDSEEKERILALLRKRLRAIHTAGEASSLELILGAKSFDDLIDRAEMIKSLSDHDNRLINSLHEQMEKISAEQNELERSREKSEQEKASLEKDRNSINSLFEENTKLIEELTDSSEKIKNEQKANEEKQKELEKALEEYEKRKAEREGREIVVTPDTDGSYVWPCPGFTYLTSSFEEWRGENNHGAIDIAEAGIYGAKVVACADGYVFSSYDGCVHDWGKDSSCGCGGGYGNYVMIDHGNGKTSIYGHLSGLTISAGEYVKAGQLIGYVGSTGYSTGAHLHFETRFNGERYDPMSEYGS